MNAFEQAIAAHEEWRTTFEHTVREGGGDLQVEAVRADNRCLLGLWLAATAKADLNPTALKMLRDVHGEFHRAAAQVLALALAGRIREAVHSMAIGTQYGQWSAVLLVALSRYAEAAGAGELDAEVSGPAA